MAEPTAPITAGILLAALAATIPGVDASVVIGAFSGSVVFVLASNDLTNLRKVAYFMLSFTGGLLAAGMAAASLSALLAILPATIVVPNGVGAMLASAMVVKLLLWLISRDPSGVIDLLRRKP